MSREIFIASKSIMLPIAMFWKTVPIIDSASVAAVAGALAAVEILKFN